MKIRKINAKGLSRHYSELQNLPTGITVIYSHNVPNAILFNKEVIDKMPLEVKEYFNKILLQSKATNYDSKYSEFGKKSHILRRIEKAKNKKEVRSWM